MHNKQLKPLILFLMVYSLIVIRVVLWPHWLCLDINQVSQKIWKPRIIDWMFVSPKIHTLKPDPQCVSTRSGSLEYDQIMRMELSWMGLESDLIKKIWESSLPLLPCEKTIAYLPGSILTRPESVGTLILFSPASRNVNDKCLLFISQLFYGIFLQQPE